jgi:hypothetical protein
MNTVEQARDCSLNGVERAPSIKAIDWVATLNRWFPQCGAFTRLSHIKAIDFDAFASCFHLQHAFDANPSRPDGLAGLDQRDHCHPCPAEARIG